MRIIVVVQFIMLMCILPSVASSHPSKEDLDIYLKAVQYVESSDQVFVASCQHVFDGGSVAILLKNSKGTTFGFFLVNKKNAEILGNPFLPLYPNTLSVAEITKEQDEFLIKKIVALLPTDAALLSTSLSVSIRSNTNSLRRYLCGSRVLEDFSWYIGE